MHNYDMRLTRNFKLRELIKSQLAERYDIDNFPNDPFVIKALKQLCIHILQPVRDHYSIPFSPSSGYRCLELNRLLGSKDTSQHIKGEAVDFEIPGVSNYEVAKWIKNNLDFDQLILEYYTLGKPNSGWIHISYISKNKNRNKVLTITKDGIFNDLKE